MKVLSLACGLGHGFEGWFANETDFQDQLQRGLVTCPLCADGRVVKLPSAPRLNLGAPDPANAGRRSPVTADPHVDGETKTSPVQSLSPPTNEVNELRTQFLAALREVVERTEDVGSAFPEQARRMHHGEQEAKPIRGQATAKEAQELREEGIDVLPLPDLPVFKRTLQ